MQEEESNPNEASQELEETPVEDESEKADVVPQVSYQITAYGADYDVDGLVRRLEKNDIFVPPFQRSYVWTLPQASQFIESLLLGLPVPGIFLARDEKTNRFQVLDGQQRLKTLLFFRTGVFNPSDDSKYRRVFTLLEVQQPFSGKSYETLDEKDRRRLDDSIIHATIVRQDSPKDDDTSIYHIFKRLNSGTTVLTAQEIRCAVYHGPFIEEIKHLNDHENWRALFGKKNRRLKDQELVLRFLALYHRADRYERPMAEFLNKFAGRNRIPPEGFLIACRRLFTSTVDLAKRAFGERAFRRERAFNAAVYDSIMVGLARRLENTRVINADRLAEVYRNLLQDEEYVIATSSHTTDEAVVALRLRKASARFASV